MKVLGKIGTNEDKMMNEWVEKWRQDKWVEKSIPMGMFSFQEIWKKMWGKENRRKEKV